MIQSITLRISLIIARDLPPWLAGEHGGCSLNIPRPRNHQGGQNHHHHHQHHRHHHHRHRHHHHQCVPGSNRISCLLTNRQQLATPEPVLSPTLILLQVIVILIIVIVSIFTIAITIIVIVTVIIIIGWFSIASQNYPFPTNFNHSWAKNVVVWPDISFVEAPPTHFSKIICIMTNFFA